LLIIKKKASSSTGYEASKLLASLEHKNIVKTHGISRNERHFILIQEYLSGGTLNDKLAFQLNWQETLKIASQICEAIIFAHNNRIIHGHLRPTNILFNDNGQVKLTDFSLEDDLSTAENSHFYYLDNEERSKASDIYATGVVLYQLFTGSLPSRQQDTSFVVRKSFTKLPENIQTLISGMISTIPQNRDHDSLQKAVTLFRKHMQNKHHKTFTNKLPHGKKQETVLDNKKTTEGIISESLLTNRKNSPVSTRMGFLFGLLLLVFAQYLYLFDGQEKVNQSMTGVYSMLVKHIEELRKH
jgi:serine/threonine-protein kinase